MFVQTRGTPPDPHLLADGRFLRKEFLPDGLADDAHRAAAADVLIAEHRAGGQVVRTETNFIHGLLFGGFLGIIGVHGAILWGVLTFLLGYIPYIGLFIAAIPAIFFAWLQFGIPGALAVIVAVGVLNLLVENPIYSFLAARKFEMPALVVIISVIFWGWLLGLVGMLFSIPFTLLLLLVFEMVEELRWINVALGVSHLFEEHKQEKTRN